ncbi:MBL fold metallo-hydrolase [Xylophilus sp. GOD-11R]|uniref:MBL fold metallo-hydrolase n=1 Tax=Xylophilus sp. GOD-11R TaxID=3089814 RepID=UPI00298C7C63|nr:MBL fold metallo-hydrolase [Xylophilus sp. GOD-11R]WPB58188.1 MBL fold metallo-hydrolase [Xylophilus sp. GOD-11R]
MLRFCNLGSGSAGNATLVEGRDGTSTSRLLIDCGLGVRVLEKRLTTAGLDYGDIDAIFITHEHSDHIGSAHQVALRHRIPVWMSEGTYAAIGAPDFDGLLRVTHDTQTVALGGFEFRPFTVPHDAREPLQLRCSDGARHLGVATDLGHATGHVMAQLAGCHALMLESNHCPELLALSRYPEFLKRRVGGRFGHLANAAAAEIARGLRHDGLQCVVAAHLSERNNRPDLARASLAEGLGWQAEQIVVADPRLGTAWLAV